MHQKVVKAREKCAKCAGKNCENAKNAKKCEMQMQCKNGIKIPVTLHCITVTKIFCIFEFFLHGIPIALLSPPFRTQRVETEGVSKSEDIEMNPKADSHPGTNQA
jgi:hypothetical protein